VEVKENPTSELELDIRRTSLPNIRVNQSVSNEFNNFKFGSNNKYASFKLKKNTIEEDLKIPNVHSFKLEKKGENRKSSKDQKSLSKENSKENLKKHSKEQIIYQPQRKLSKDNLSEDLQPQRKLSKDMSRKLSQDVNSKKTNFNLRKFSEDLTKNKTQVFERKNSQDLPNIKDLSLYPIVEEDEEDLNDYDEGNQKH
jgi:hypothetical protein